MPLGKIRDIQSGMENIEVVGRVTNISEKRQVSTKYGLANVAKDPELKEDLTKECRL